MAYESENFVDEIWSDSDIRQSQSPSTSSANDFFDLFKSFLFHSSISKIIARQKYLRHLKNLEKYF